MKRIQWWLTQGKLRTDRRGYLHFDLGFGNSSVAKRVAKEGKVGSPQKGFVRFCGPACVMALEMAGAPEEILDIVRLYTRSTRPPEPTEAKEILKLLEKALSSYGTRVLR
jgi:hypothetical protein